MEESTRAIPKWLWGVIAIGGCVPIVLLLAMVASKSEPDVLPVRTASAQDNSRELEDRLQLLERKLAEFEEQSLVEETGVVTFTIPAGVTIGYAEIKFKRRQPKQAVVLTGETGSGGTFLATKTEAITAIGCRIAVQQNNAQPFGGSYDARIGYVVLRGMGEPEAVEAAPQVSPKQVKAPRTEHKPPPSKTPSINPQPAQAPPAKQPAAQLPPQPTDLTWIEYRNDCGLDAQKVNEARTEQVFREKYKGKLIRWSGTVRGIQERMLSSGYLISIQMQPTDAIHSDLSLRVGKELADTALSLKDEDTVTFEGYLSSQGGTITSHTVDVVRLSKQ